MRRIEGFPFNNSIPAFQLSWDDCDGYFPADRGYSPPAWMQPRPGTFEA